IRRNKLTRLIAQLLDAQFKKGAISQYKRLVNSPIRFIKPPPELNVSDYIKCLRLESRRTKTINTLCLRKKHIERINLPERRTRRFGISTRFAFLFSEVPLFAVAAQNFAG